MTSSLVFLPDISGFTKFVQSTETSHSQHIIAELLELLIASNDIGLTLAEIEGDALFFYKEGELPSKSELEAQMEKMMTVFYSHLRQLEKNRICPCEACVCAPELNLKIIAHAGELQFMTVQNQRKPFGPEVIQAHRLMKNSVDSDHYILMSDALIGALSSQDEGGPWRPLTSGTDTYDDVAVDYHYHILDKASLALMPHAHAAPVELDGKPTFSITKQLPTSSHDLLEHLTDYSQRPYWTKGLKRVEYNENEVTRLGTEHTCVINDKQLNITPGTKEGEEKQIVYGELSSSIPKIDRLYLFYVITPVDESSCEVELEVHMQADSLLGKLMVFLAGGPFKKAMTEGLGLLEEYIRKKLMGELVAPLGA